MPKHVVRLRSWQDALFETRRLISPGGAAPKLGTSRQAVHHSAARPGGRVLMWEFYSRRLAEREWEKYVDFGSRDEPESETAWVGRTPDELIEQAVERYRLFVPAGQEEV